MVLHITTITYLTLTLTITTLQVILRRLMSVGVVKEKEAFYLSEVSILIKLLT